MDPLSSHSSEEYLELLQLAGLTDGDLDVPGVLPKGQMIVRLVMHG
jgi:hypothetical protein